MGNLCKGICEALNTASGHKEFRAVLYATQGYSLVISDVSHHLLTSGFYEAIARLLEVWGIPPYYSVPFLYMTFPLISP